MNKNIQFDPTNHVYKRLSDGKALAGVTSIIASKDKAFLVPWACKLMHDYIKGKWNAEEPFCQKEIDEILEKGKKEYTRVSNEGKAVGTATHDWIESFFKNKTQEITSDIEKTVGAFVRWYDARKPRVIHSECVVGITSDEEYNYAGKFDLIAEIDGKTYIIDFKTSTGIYSEAFLQLAAYQYACEKESGLKIDGRMIVRIGKDGVCEELIVPTPYDLDIQSFKALLTATRFDSYIDNHFPKKSGIVQYNAVQY